MSGGALMWIVGMALMLGNLANAHRVPYRKFGRVWAVHWLSCAVLFTGAALMFGGSA